MQENKRYKGLKTGKWISIRSLVPGLLLTVRSTRCLNKTKPREFADDTNITAAGECLHDIEDAVNSDLENLRQWFMANKLSSNVAKTEKLLVRNQC